MSVPSALSRVRLLPTFLGALLLVSGLVMFMAGSKLASLGGSLYYLVSGMGLAACGVLLLMALRFALWLFTLCLSVATVWALWDVGLDREQLMPRLFIWFLIGVLLLMPRVRQGLRPRQGSLFTRHLLVAVVLAGIALDPVTLVRQYRADYQGLLAVLVPALDSAPLTVDARQETVALVPEGRDPSEF